MKYFSLFAFFLIVTAQVGCHGSDGTTVQVAKQIQGDGFDSPRTALLSFFEGIRDCDREKTLSATSEPKLISDYVDAYVRTIQSMKRFAEADLECFGEGGFPADFAQRIVDDVDESEIELISNDSAEWIQNPKVTFPLKNGSRGWQIDPTTRDFQKLLQMGASIFRDNVSMYDQLTAGLRDGEIKTRDECRDVMAKLKQQLRL